MIVIGGFIYPPPSYKTMFSVLHGCVCRGIVGKSLVIESGANTKFKGKIALLRKVFLGAGKNVFFEVGNAPVASFRC